MSINSYQSDEAFHSGMEDEMARMDPCGALGKRYMLANAGVVFECKAYDDQSGYLMVPEVNVCADKWVSPRAINRSFIETNI